MIVGSSTAIQRFITVLVCTTHPFSFCTAASAAQGELNIHPHPPGISCSYLFRKLPPSAAPCFSSQRIQHEVL